MSNYIKRIICNTILISIVCSNIAFYYLMLNEPNVSRTDYISFLTATEIIKSGDGKKLYDIPLQHQVQQELIGKYYKTEGTLLFMNIPFVAIIYFPASIFSLIWGYRFMVAAVLALFILVIWESGRIIGKRTITFRNLLFIGLVFYPLSYDILNAQIVPIIVLGILVGIYYSLTRKKYFLLGLFLGLLIIKFQYLTIVPFIFLLSKEKIKTIKGFSLSFVAIILSSILLISWSSLIKYPSFLISTDVPKFSVDPWRIFSLHSLFKVLPFMKDLNFGYIFGLEVVVYIGIFIFYWLRYKNVSTLRSFQSAVILAVPLSVHVFPQDVILLLLPLFLFYHEYLLNKKNTYALFMTIALYLLPLIDLLKLNIFGALMFLIFGITALFPTEADSNKVKLATN